jgi:hypothetical protein
METIPRCLSFGFIARLFVKTPLDNEKNEKECDQELTGAANDNEFEVKTLSAAVGTAATKREVRRVASAKLLAMLFPECSSKRNLMTPLMTRTLHLPEPYDSRSTTHTARQPRIVVSGMQWHG